MNFAGMPRGLAPTGLSLKDVYKRQLYARYNFSRLCVEAGVREQYSEPIEETMTRAFSRLVAIDSRRWIQFLLDILPRLDGVDLTRLSHVEQQMLNMFYTTVWQETIEDFGADERCV